MKTWACGHCGRSGSRFEYRIVWRTEMGRWKVSVKCDACHQVTTFTKHGVLVERHA
jgi:hypothetical protein